MAKKWRKIAGICFGAALFSVAAVVLSREIATYGPGKILQAVSAIPPGRIAMACLFAALCYGALTCYDLLALRYLGNPLPYRRLALASFVGYAFSHNVGLSLVTGAPMKYRVYSTWGLRPVDIVKIAAFCGFTFWAGFTTLLGLALLVEPGIIREAFHLPLANARPLGLALLGAVGGYLLLSRRRRPFRIAGHGIFVPGPRFALGQMLAGSAEWLFASATIFVLLGGGAGISYPAFLAVFLFAYLSGFVSQVPGGLGVFETVIIVSLSHRVPSPVLMGAMLAYRGIYYLLPLAAALLLLARHEVRRRR